MLTKQRWVTRTLFYDLTAADSSLYPKLLFQDSIPRACSNGTSLKVQSPKASVNVLLPHPANMLAFFLGWGMLSCSQIWGWLLTSWFLFHPQCSERDFLVIIFSGSSVLCSLKVIRGCANWKGVKKPPEPKWVWINHWVLFIETAWRALAIVDVFHSVVHETKGSLSEI